MRIAFGVLIQIFSTVGVIFLFGLLIASLRRIFCSISGAAGPKILLATGFIGTPIHELSHALMCIVFGHKIRKIKLYDPDPTSGTLGYVDHSYNRKNLYHQIGNFFIGVSPLLFGAFLIVLLMYLLVPSVFLSVTGVAFELSVGPTFPIGEILAFFWSAIMAIFCSLGSLEGWIFILLSILIATHMELSGSDIKSGLWGLLFILLIYIPISVTVGIFSPTGFDSLTKALASFGIVFSALLSISVIFLLFLIITALIIKILVTSFKR